MGQNQGETNSSLKGGKIHIRSHHGIWKKSRDKHLFLSRQSTYHCVSDSWIAVRFFQFQKWNLHCDLLPLKNWLSWFFTTTCITCWPNDGVSEIRFWISTSRTPWPIIQVEPSTTDARDNRSVWATSLINTDAVFFHLSSFVRKFLIRTLTTTSSMISHEPREGDWTFFQRNSG